MKRLLILFFTISICNCCLAQKVDSICFHLYTDSLKKGTYNYINVDGKYSNGKWKPLSAKEIVFTTTYGSFDGNELILPADCLVDSLRVKAVLKAEPWKQVEKTIWIKKKPDDEKLPTKEEFLNPKKSEKKKPKNKSP